MAATSLNSRTGISLQAGYAKIEKKSEAAYLPCYTRILIFIPGSSHICMIAFESQNSYGAATAMDQDSSRILSGVGNLLPSSRV